MNCLSELVIQNRLTICTSSLSRHKKKKFLYQIVTGSSMIILSVKNPGQLSTSIPKRNINGNKVLLCIWRNMKGVVYYKLLKPNETIIAIINN